MSSKLTVEELFHSAGLSLSDRVPWKTPIPETHPGVYIIVADDESIDIDDLPLDERVFWVPGQSIVYIGCTKRSLRMRLNQFYRHRFGNGSPHRGGQALTLLACQLWVYWARTDDPRDTEHALIEEFMKNTGAKRPFGNRRNERRV